MRVVTRKFGRIEYYFERRRYGTGPSMRFYTWLMYRVDGSTKCKCNNPDCEECNESAAEDQ